MGLQVPCSELLLPRWILGDLFRRTSFPVCIQLETRNHIMGLYIQSVYQSDIPQHSPLSPTLLEGCISAKRYGRSTYRHSTNVLF